MLEVKELVKLHILCTDHVTIRSELKYLIGAQAVGTVNLEPRSGSNLAKYPRFYVRAGQQPARPNAVRVFGRVWNRTEPNRWSKPGPLAGYPDPLLTLHIVLEWSPLLPLGEMLSAGVSQEPQVRPFVKKSL